MDGEQYKKIKKETFCFKNGIGNHAMSQGKRKIWNKTIDNNAKEPKRRVLVGKKIYSSKTML